MKTLTVRQSKPYQIQFGAGLLQQQLSAYVLQHPYHKIVLLTDTTIADLYSDLVKSLKATFSTDTLQITIPAGEQHKSRASKAAIEDQMLQHGCRRDTLLIAVGGGVITDLGGFVAATFCRGIDVIYCPTTLLAMVDASIGGKTAINTELGKNLIGAFYQPKTVIIDTNFLVTLEQDDYLSGLGEVIKYALLFDDMLFQTLESQLPRILDRQPDTLEKIIVRCCELKEQVVARDEFEGSIRALLNFGHTMAHAIEHQKNYQIQHGLAVAIGCYLEMMLADQAGLMTDKSLSNRLLKLLQRLPFSWGKLMAEISLPQLTEAMRFDKKSQSGKVRFIKLTAIAAYKELIEHPLPKQLINDNNIYVSYLALNSQELNQQFLSICQ